MEITCYEHVEMSNMRRFVEYLGVLFVTMGEIFM